MVQVGSLVGSLLSAAMVSAASAAAPPTSEDFARASTPLPRAHLTGPTFEARSRVLSEALKTYDDLTVEPCETYGLEGVMAVWETLHALTNAGLNEVYESAGDNRRLSQLQEFLIPDEPGLQNVLRDSLCVESVMMYAHHLAEADKNEFHALSSLPAMPEAEHTQTTFSSEHNRVFLHYQQSLTCSICHADPEEIVNPSAPAWAEEFFTVMSKNTSSYEGEGTPFEAILRWYSWPLRATRDEHTVGGYTRVNMRIGGRLYMWEPWAETCTVVPMGLDPVSPYFMQGEGAVQEPDEVYNDIPCEVWDKKDPLSGDEHMVWYAKSNGRPVKMFTSGGPRETAQTDWVSYQAMPVAASIFEIPDYCNFPGATVASDEVKEVARGLTLKL